MSLQLDLSLDFSIPEPPITCPADYFTAKGGSPVSPMPSTPRDRAPHNGTSTSRAAAATVVASGKSKFYRQVVLECIRAAGARGITRSDIEQATGLKGDTVRPRVYELMGRDKGKTSEALVIETGETRIPDRGGKVRQAVLVAVEVGK